MAGSLMVKETSLGSTEMRVSLPLGDSSGVYFEILILLLDAMRTFAEAQSQWYPTWPQNLDDRAMAIDYVKMWKHCDGN